MSSSSNYSMYLIKEPFRITGGFYVDGTFHSLVCVDGKSYRRRVEILCFRDRDIFLDFNRRRTDYTIPGGECERNLPDAVQLIRECEKMGSFLPKNIEYKLTYKIEYDEISNPRPKWMNQLPILYDGVINCVYTGEFSDPVDSEYSIIGNWYEYSKIKKILKDPHQRALKSIRR